MKPTHQLLGLRLLACYFGVATWAHGQPLYAAVTVETVDGRVLSGEVDTQTDDQLLWIRQQEAQILMTTSVHWAAITAATDDAGAVPLDQLSERLRGLASDEPAGFLARQISYETPVDFSGSGGVGDDLPAHSSRRRALSRRRQVSSLEVEAFLVNLDRDVEPDGIELVIAALDDRGDLVPVKGNLYARLWGERIQPDGALIRFEELQIWSQSVTPADFSSGVARYAMRFRTVHPEFDLELRPEALVNVRLGVFGQGNFAATAPVEIRKFNPFRDRMQLDRGSRFLPDELSEKVRHVGPNRRPNLRRSIR